jgi:hypothetical protein
MIVTLTVEQVHGIWLLRGVSGLTPALTLRAVAGLLVEADRQAGFARVQQVISGQAP